MSETVTLLSSGLLSKFGFNDGDEPDEVWDLLDRAGLTKLVDNWHDVLIQLVEEYLLPALDQRVEVQRIETNHNPIRARMVDGVEVDDMRHEDDQPFTLTPEAVEVPMERVMELLLATRDD